VTAPSDSAIVKGGRTKVLAQVGDEDGQTVSEILSFSPFTRQYVSRTLNTLDDEGLVESECFSEDARKKQYTITEQGQQLLDVLDGIYTEA